jgi:hypothetical protein
MSLKEVSVEITGLSPEFMLAGPLIINAEYCSAAGNILRFLIFGIINSSDKCNNRDKNNKNQDQFTHNTPPYEPDKQCLSARPALRTLRSDEKTKNPTGISTVSIINPFSAVNQADLPAAYFYK